MTELVFQNPFEGPFIPVTTNPDFPVPQNDNSVALGTPAKRYKSINVIDVQASTAEFGTGTTVSATSIAGLTNLNGTPVAQYVTNPGAGVANNIATFVSPSVIHDSGFPISGGFETVAHAAATYMPFSGGTFTGDTTYGGHNIGNISYAELADNGVPANPIANRARINYVNAQDRLYMLDSTGTNYKIIIQPDINAFMPTAGGTFSGNVAFSGHDITGVGNFNGTAATTLVFNSGTGVAGDVATFSAPNQIQDSGTLLSGLETKSHAAATYMPLAGGTFSGDVAFGAHQITGLSQITTNNSDVLIGTGVSTDLANQHGVLLGDTTVSTGSNTGYVGIGQGVTITGNQGVAIGYTSTAANGALALGKSANAANTSVALLATASGAGSIGIGNGAVANTTGAISIGNSTNATAHSLLVGDGSFTNWRSVTTSTDLGTTTAPFKSAWLRDSAIATGGMFSQTMAVAVNNTTTETSLLTGTSVGGLVYSAGQGVGSVIRFAAGFLLSVGVADTCTLRFKVNGTAVLTAVVGGAVSLALPNKLLADFTVRTATVAGFVCIIGNGTAAVVTQQVAAYNPAIANTWDLTAQWSAASGSDTINLQSISIETLRAI